MAARAVAHPHREDRLVRTHLLPHCVRSLQPRLLGLLSVSLGPPFVCIHTFSIGFGRDISRGASEILCLFLFNSPNESLRFGIIHLETDIANVVALHTGSSKQIKQETSLAF